MQLERRAADVNGTQRGFSCIGRPASSRLALEGVNSVRPAIEDRLKEAMSMSEERLEQLGIPRRAFFTRMTAAAFVAPVVVSFALDGVAEAQTSSCANMTFSNQHQGAQGNQDCQGNQDGQGNQ